MNFIKHVSFRVKLILAIAVISALLLVVAVTSITGIKKIEAQSVAVAEVSFPQLDGLLQADRDLYQALVAERALLQQGLSSESIADNTGSHKDNIGQVRERVGLFASLTGKVSPEAGKLSSQFFAQMDAWEVVSKKVIQLSLDGAITEAAALSYGDASTAFGTMRDTLDKLGEYANKEAAQKTHQVTTSASTTLSTVMVLTAIGLVLCLVFVIVVPAWVSRALNQVIDSINDIADGDGDLTVRLPDQNRDEFGRLGSAFNRFIGKLEVLIKDIAVSSEKIAATVAEVAEVAAQTSQSIQRQQIETDQISTAVHELSMTSQEVAQNASEAAKATRDADAQALEGQEYVEQTVRGIYELAEKVEAANVMMDQLGSDSDNIGKVLDVIHGIAEQTNLLALNAAIEAARAGEHGRGFAVVADEVRTLAHRTQQSTHDIQQMIERLQNGARDAVAAMDLGRKLAHDSTEQSQKTQDALKAVTGAIASIADMNSQIANAAQAESAVAEEVNVNVSTVSTIAQENADGALHTERASEEMARLTAELQGLISRFKVSV